jgi:glycosyltransferase involved in cell wall biosynthesis
MKSKVINIIHHPYAYEYINNDERPDINWDTPGGSWVGIWRGNWSDILGSEILKITDKFLYEVWLPDLRADKIYEHRFKNNLIIKIFPANYIFRPHGIKINRYIISTAMIEQLNAEIIKYKVILHLNCDPLLPLAYNIISNFKGTPIILSLHSDVKSPHELITTPRLNVLSTFNYLSQLLRIRKILKYINAITYQNNGQYSYLKIIGYNGLSRKLTMGCDFDFWVPGAKGNAKSILGISQDTFVISMASRFNELKQIDKVIQALTLIDKNDEFNFVLLIAGHGENKYLEYLVNYSTDLNTKKKIRFLGYLSGEDMLKVYQGSDLFISASTSEGGPVSVIKALACEIPVFSTKVGGTYDIMNEKKVGMFVDIDDFSEWKIQLSKILSGYKIEILDREIAKEKFHWPNIAVKFIELYDHCKK